MIRQWIAHDLSLCFTIFHQFLLLVFLAYATCLSFPLAVYPKPLRNPHKNVKNNIIIYRITSLSLQKCRSANVMLSSSSYFSSSSLSSASLSKKEQLESRSSSYVFHSFAWILAATSEDVFAWSWGISLANIKALSMEERTAWKRGDLESYLGVWCFLELIGIKGIRLS